MLQLFKRVNKGDCLIKRYYKIITLSVVAWLVILYLYNEGIEIASFKPEPSILTEEAKGLESAYPVESVESVEPAKPAESVNPEKPDQPAQLKNTLPEGFVYIAEELPEAKLDVRYATTHNFTGQIVDGYSSGKLCATLKAVEALKNVQTSLKDKGYGLLLYDAYRPKRAVEFFIKWASLAEDNLTKSEFYPDIDKKDLFKLSYLAKRSAHSKGSTIDLTLFHLSTGEAVDMGSTYDFLGPISNHGTSLITEEQTRNRNLLRDTMKACGFKELRTEWWHYQLIDEPFPETFFDFVIE